MGSKFLKITFSFLLIGTLLGCNQANQKERSLCTDEYINDFNNYHSTLEYMRSQPNYTSRQMLQKQCEIMLIKHNGVNCIASDSSGALVTPDPFAIETNCNANTRYLNPTISSKARAATNQESTEESTSTENLNSSLNQTEKNEEEKNRQANTNKPIKIKASFRPTTPIRPIDLKATNSTVEIRIRSQSVIANSSALKKIIFINGQFYDYSTSSDVESVASIIQNNLSKQASVVACELSPISENNIFNKQFILTNVVVENSVDSVIFEEILTYRLTFTSPENQPIHMICHKYAHKNATFRDIISSSDIQNTFREKVFVEIIR